MLPKIAIFDHNTTKKYKKIVTKIIFHAELNDAIHLLLNSDNNYHSK